MWKRMKSQSNPKAMERISEEMHSDFNRFLEVCRERDDGQELADRLVRYTENAYIFAHYNGIRRGYRIGVDAAKDKSERIIRVIATNLDATPTEICEHIDRYNSRFADINDKRWIQIKWPELRKRGYRWTEIAHIPKVKNYIVRARRRANQISRIDAWQRLMREHDSNRKRQEP